jgi:hypothetical protein
VDGGTNALPDREGNCLENMVHVDRFDRAVGNELVYFTTRWPSRASVRIFQRVDPARPSVSLTLGF